MIVQKKYKPYTLRIIYLINLFFWRNLVSRTAELFKIFAFLAFFALGKKHSRIKYFGKILEFARDAGAFVGSRGAMPELLWVRGGMPELLWA